MAGSGMRIFNAHPRSRGPARRFPLNPWEGTPIPAWLTFGGWLGGARHWHFAMMWLLVANGLLYLGFLFFHGEWRDIVPRRGDARDAIEMLKFYLFVRRDHPHQGKHNALQKSAYFAMPVLGIVIVLSGLAIWKPVTLGFITALFVNYKWARFVHFVAMALLLAARARARVHGLHRRSVLAARDRHRLVRPGALARGAQRAALLPSLRPALDSAPPSDAPRHDARSPPLPHHLRRLDRGLAPRRVRQEPARARRRCSRSPSERTSASRKGSSATRR